ncbi:MAG: hypothetical protein H7288_22425 [Kineosporiaceae bacterium]|nr:hypothetical protein [Aeromicrobium sp.]
MPNDSTTASVKDIRKFAIIQFVITFAFLAFVFWMFSGTDADYPPIWLIVVMMAAIAVGAFFSERVWLTGTPLDPEDSADTNQLLALEAYANQTVRKLIYSEAPLILAVLICFVGSYGGWPVLIAALPGLAVQAWETWPHLRNTSMSAAILESRSADSQLVENFVRS